MTSPVATVAPRPRRPHVKTRRARQVQQQQQSLAGQIVAVGQAAALAATVTKGGLTPAELAAWQADYAARLQTIEEHPEQTLGHIEEAVAAAAKEPLRLLTERAAHAKANATPCHCPECHQPLTDQKHLSRGIDSRFGRLRLWRGYGWCPQCAPWCFPADHALGLARKAAASP